MTEKHFIEVEDGESVAAVHHKNDSDDWIFFCHGFGSNKEGSYERRAKKAVEEGYNAVRFDFRGNGESDGDFIDQNLSSKIKDLETVIEFFEPGSYLVFGSSFGGKVALHHSANNADVEAVIGRAPVTYNSVMSKYRSVVEEKGEFQHHEGATIDRSFFEDLDKHGFSDVAGNLECPAAIFHGGEDTTVHFKNTAEASEEMDTNLMVQKFKGESHSFTDEAEEKMLQQLFAWLEAQ